MPVTRARKRAPEPTTSAATTPVSAIMTRNVTTVRAGTSLDTVAELFLGRGLSRVPVLDAAGHLLGMVSKTDLVKRAQDAADAVEASPREPGFEELRGFQVQGERPTVDDVMSATVTAVGETASIQRAAQLMVGSQLHGLPVTTASGELVGFVSSMDVLAWLSGLR
jgi:CBS domain-containing protein